MATFFIALGIFCTVYFPLGFLLDLLTQRIANARKRKRYAVSPCQRQRTAVN